MGLIDQITQMQSQGIPENEIVQNLQEQGISPKEITDGINQAKVKNAVTSETNNLPGMQPSIMQNPNNMHAPSTQEIAGEQYIPQQEEYAPQPQEDFQTQEYFPVQDASQQYMPMADSGTNIDTTIEVAEQVFLEKSANMKKQMRDLNEFKTLTEAKVQNFQERLQKIESIIDKLQISILEKIGSYGSNLNSIKNEMNMMQNTFSQALPSLIHKKHSSTHTAKKKTTKKKSKK